MLKALFSNLHCQNVTFLHIVCTLSSFHFGKRNETINKLFTPTESNSCSLKNVFETNIERESNLNGTNYIEMYVSAYANEIVT